MSRVKRLLPEIKTLVQIAIILFSVFVAGGGFYDLLEENLESIVIVPWTGKPSPVHYSTEDQTLTESIMAMFLYLCIIVGLILSYKSTQVKSYSRKADYMLLTGIVLVLIALAGFQYLIILRWTVGR